MTPIDRFIAELLRLDYISTEQADLIREVAPKYEADVIREFVGEDPDMETLDFMRELHREAGE